MPIDNVNQTPIVTTLTVGQGPAGPPGNSSNVNWNAIQNKPTTRAGYGITDAAAIESNTQHIGMAELRLWDPQDGIYQPIHILDFELYLSTIQRVYIEGNRYLLNSDDDVPWTRIASKPTTFPPSSHAHSVADVSGAVATVNSNGTLIVNRVGSTVTVNLDLTRINTWQGKQSFAKASIDGLGLKTSFVTASRALTAGETIILVDPSFSGNCSGTANCRVIIDETGCATQATCSWNSVDCADFLTQEECFSPCAWEINYCESLSDQISCESYSECTWNLAVDGDCSDFNGDEATCNSVPGCSWDVSGCFGTYEMAPPNCSGGVYSSQCTGGVQDLCVGGFDCEPLQSIGLCTGTPGCNWQPIPIDLALPPLNVNPNKAYVIRVLNGTAGVTLTPASGNTINGGSVATIPPSKATLLASYSINWVEALEPVLT